MKKALFLIKMFCISGVVIIPGNTFAQMDDYYYEECYYHGGCESSSSDAATDAIVENVVQSDFDSTFTADATSIGQEAAAEGFDLIGFVLRYGIFKHGDLDVKSLSLPLSYTFQFENSGDKLKLKLPLGMVDVEGSKAYKVGLGMDYGWKVTDKWRLTPSLNFNFVKSDDFNSDGQLASGLLTSTYAFELGKYKLHMGNMVGYYRSMSFSGDQYDPDISNTVVKNGFMMAIPMRNVASWELFVTDTRYFGTDLYIDQYNEIGFSFGYKKAEKDPVTSKIKKYFKYLRAGITYMYASGDSNGFSFNFGYSF
ncbi:hypothetical protein ACFL6W_07750 [Thermodesulfobacteriota bacterium]